MTGWPAMVQGGRLDVSAALAKFATTQLPKSAACVAYPAECKLQCSATQCQWVTSVKVATQDPCKVTPGQCVLKCLPDMT